MPVSPTTSGSAPPLVLMTGTPQAIASEAGMPKPSYKDGTTAMVALRVITGKFFILNAPGEMDNVFYPQFRYEIFYDSVLFGFADHG